MSPIVTFVSYLTTSGAAAAVCAPSAITPAAARPITIAIAYTVVLSVSPHFGPP